MEGKAKFEAIAADFQEVKVARRELRAFTPMGATADQNLSITIARHLGKMKSITYEAKDSLTNDGQN